MAAVLAGASALAGEARAADPYVIAGELARVNLPHRSVIVKLAAPWREVEVRLDDSTVISSRGRPLRLPDLRPGERILVDCVDDAGGVHHARRIKIGGRLPSPSPR